MPGVFKKAANWLGLIDEERYADDIGPESADELSPDGGEDGGASQNARLAGVTVLPVRHQGQPEGYARGGSGTSVYPMVIVAHSFDDAEKIGDAYRSGVPVVINLAALATEVARRVLDFDAGMIFAMGGRLEKLAPKLFLLSPAGVEVSQDERDRVLAHLARAA